MRMFADFAALLFDDGRWKIIWTPPTPTDAVLFIAVCQNTAAGRLNSSAVDQAAHLHILLIISSSIPARSADRPVTTNEITDINY